MSDTSGLGVLSTMALAALGGCWWAIEVTPDWMQTLANYLPTGWAMNSLHQLVSFQQQGTTAILSLLSGAILLGWLSHRTFRYQ